MATSTLDLPGPFSVLLRYPPGIVGVAPGGLPAAMEGIIPGGIPVTHNLPTVAHPSQAPSPNQPTKHGDNREHPNEQ